MLFKHTTLDNGLQIVGEINDAAHTAAVGFFVRAGTRDEPKSLMGVSHFLEHMMFKGTARRSYEDVNREFDEIGANYNASTSHEVTNYWAHVLPQFLPQAIDLISDMLRPALRLEDFTMEKNVILEEIGMYADRPFWVVYEQVMEDFFGTHPLGYRVLGTNESIKALTRDQMHEYFAHRYSPENVVVSLAGKLDFDSAVQQIAKSCAPWPRTGATRDYGNIQPHAAARTTANPKLNRSYLALVCPGPSVQDDDRYTAAVLANLLGDSDGSRLYWKLIDPGLADEAELSHHPSDRTGAFMAYVSCDPARLAQVESILDRVIDSVAADLTDAEVERSRNKIAMELVVHHERPAGRMMGLGGQWLYLGQYRPLEEEMRRIMAVDVAAIRRLIEQYPFKPRAVGRLTP